MLVIKTRDYKNRDDNHDENDNNDGDYD
jgi:hypothetical protein